MPFGQIEQSWFEDDLWSLHSIPPSLEHRKEIEPNRQDDHLKASIEPVPRSPTNATENPLPESSTTYATLPATTDKFVVKVR